MVKTMAVLDGDIGNVIRCDRCGVINNFENDNFENADFQIRSYVWNPLFAGRKKPVTEFDFCKSCAVEITPLIHRLRDIDELNAFIGKLRRATDEKRKQRNQNNRPTACDACKCCKGCSQRRS
jgi:hypothetical protein